jgi:O-antigen ligase
LTNLDSKELFFKQDQIYIGLFMLWAIILPWSLAGMQIIMVLLVLTSIVINISRGHSPIIYHPFYIFIGLYLFMNLITILSTDNKYIALRSAFNNDWVILCVPFIASIYLPEKWKKNVLIALIISATISGLYGIIQFFDGVEYIRNKPLAPLGGFFRSSGGYSSWFAFAGNQLFVFAFVITFVLFSEKKLRLFKFFLVAAIVILLSIIGSQTRSAWLGLIFVILLGTFLRSKKYFIYAIGVLLLSSVIVFLIFPDIQARFSSIFSAAQNKGRLNIWHTSWIIFKENWLVGIGHGNFDFNFEKYKVPGFYDAGGHAHNDYLNVAVLNGIIGLISWSSMWIAFFYYSVRAYRLPERTNFEKITLLAGVSGIGGILVAAVFQCYYTDLENNIFWWFVASMALQIIVQSPNKKQNPDRK